MLIPLTFVLVVSMIKDIFEDHKRHNSDKQENNQLADLFDPHTKTFSQVQWRNLKVGEIIRVNNEKFMPADIVILASSGQKGICYIETKNLDGETNLKHKQALKQFNKSLVKENESDPLNLELLSQTHGTIKCSNPNDKIYQFEGTYYSETFKESFVVGIDNFLLRGSSLRNTDWVIGVVVYAGHETKVMKNSVKSRQKKSKMELDTNRNIIFIFLVQVLCCILGAVIGATWMVNHLYTAKYLQFDEEDPWSSNWFLLFIKTTGTWFLIFTYQYFIYFIVTLCQFLCL